MAKQVDSRINELNQDDIEFEGVMRLIEGIVLHVYDKIAISNKWVNKDIGMKTLLTKKKTLKELGKWMKTWQWDVWVNLFSEHNRYNPKSIKKKFEAIRKKSVSHVNKRIKEKQKKEKDNK